MALGEKGGGRGGGRGRGRGLGREWETENGRRCLKREELESSTYGYMAIWHEVYFLIRVKCSFGGIEVRKKKDSETVLGTRYEAQKILTMS